MKTVETVNKAMLNFDTIKIYGINALGFLSTLTNLDINLKRALIVATLTYTIVKIIAVIKNDIRRNDEND